MGRVELDLAWSDIRGLIRDYADLENVMADLGGRLERVSGTQEPRVNLALGAEALQRDIWRTTTTWEEVLIDHCGLPPPPTGPVRDGWAVQRAVHIILPRLRILSSIGPTAVFPQGHEEAPENISGQEAILIMQALHRRVGWAIGLRHLVHELRGLCGACKIEGGLRREDGSEAVYCALCGVKSTWDDYQRECLAMVKAHGKK